MRDILVSTAIWGLIIVELKSKHTTLCVCVCVWLGLFSLQFWLLGRIRLCNVMCGNRSQALALWEAQTTVYCSVVTLEHWTPHCSYFPSQNHCCHIKLSDSYKLILPQTEERELIDTLTSLNFLE